MGAEALHRRDHAPFGLVHLIQEIPKVAQAFFQEELYGEVTNLFAHGKN
jgi:hypothetical protein